MPKVNNFGFPSFYPYNYNRYYNRKPTLNINKNNYNPSSDEKNAEKSCQNDNHNLATDSQVKPIFEIFGLKLFMDDILILCLLYFLYEENVKDELLFLVLLMLLIS